VRTWTRPCLIGFSPSSASESEGCSTWNTTNGRTTDHLAFHRLFHVEQSVRLVVFDLPKTNARRSRGAPSPSSSAAGGESWGAAMMWVALGEYSEMVRRWAQKVNLVSQEDLPSFSERHVLPALALRHIIQALPHQRLLDVGSGAGLPGIPLAIALPSSEITLIESRRRRANFLRHVVRSLGLANVTVVCDRVEAWTPVHSFDIIMSRAVTDLASLALMASHCLHPAGLLLVTTGPETGHRDKGMRAILNIAEDDPVALRALVAHPIRGARRDA